MKLHMKYFLITFSFSVSLYSLSFNHDLLNPNYKPTKTNTLKAGCAPASKRLTLQYNDVSALLETGGIMFLDRANGIDFFEGPYQDADNLDNPGPLVTSQPT